MQKFKAYSLLILLLKSTKLFKKIMGNNLDDDKIVLRESKNGIIKNYN